MTDRKLAFYEVKGLALEAQLAFEKIQEHVMRNMTPASLRISIDITPPEDDDGRFGRIAYTVGTKTAPVKSKSFHTLFKDGKIIADGTDEADASQLDLLDLEMPEDKKERRKNVIAIKEASNG
jgi:hypothetical protein